MSVSSSITLSLAMRNINSFDVVRLLLRTGWSPSFQGHVSFLPLGDDGNFDWKCVPESNLPDALQEIEAKSGLGEMLGILLVSDNSDCGGEFLIYSDCKVVFSLTVNRRLLSESEHVTDIGWYITKIFRTFKNGEMQITSMHWIDEY